MTESRENSAAGTGAFRRRIGGYGSARSGPLVLCVGGIHGNERAGVDAARAVVARLEGERTAIRGRFVALCGNLRALARGDRFVDRDLNRNWLPGEPPFPRTEAGEEPVEEGERQELLAVLKEELSGARGPVHFLDLHTSSAEGPPFLSVGDTLRNRSFARRLELPIVLGLEEHIDGALLEYMNNLGHITVGVEAGQHGSPEAVKRHEALIWLALVAAGCLEPGAVPDLGRHREFLRSSAPGVPAIQEVRHYHQVGPGDGFVMNPGYRNFDEVESRAVIARDASGPIRTAERCGILLPLYQSQGNDGFFTVREVGSTWLAASWFCRQAGLPGLISWLPGIRRHPDQRETFLVSPAASRIFPRGFFHLLGFRKLRAWGGGLVVSRRTPGPQNSRVGEPDEMEAHPAA